MTGKATFHKQCARRRRRGLALVEFALVFPLLLLLVLGGLEYALQFHVQHVMTNAARDAARQLAVRGATNADAIAQAQSELNGINATFTITATQPPPTGANTQDVVVTISVPRSQVSLGYIATSGTIQVAVWMRKEGS